MERDSGSRRDSTQRSSTQSVETGDLGRPRIPIDPRIKQRRIALRRANGRRRLHLLLAGLGAGATIGGALAILHSPLVRVRHLQVSGSTHVSSAEIARVAGVGSATPMVDLNPAKIQVSLERLAWISSAVVTRHWPGTVTITVLERKPIAQVLTSSGVWAELDVSGKVLERSPSSWQGLVALVGFGSPGPPGSVLRGARRGLVVAAGIPRGALPQVKEVVQGPDGQVSLELAGHVDVRLGFPSEVKAKMAALVTMLAQVNMSGAKAIDLEVPDAPTLTRS